MGSIFEILYQLYLNQTPWIIIMTLLFIKEGNIINIFYYLLDTVGKFQKNCLNKEIWDICNKFAVKMGFIVKGHNFSPTGPIFMVMLMKSRLKKVLAKHCFLGHLE